MVLLSMLPFLLHAWDVESSIIKRSTYHPSNAKCVDYSIPVSIIATGVDFIASKWKDNYELMDFVSHTVTRPGANFTPPIGGSVDLSGDYKISGTFCTPKTNTENSSTVLLASHGLGFDRKLVNCRRLYFSILNVYLATGIPNTNPTSITLYSTWFLKAYLSSSMIVSVQVSPPLGKLLESRVRKLADCQISLSGFNNQAINQVRILEKLAGLIKNGKYTGTIGIPKKLVLVGHSFGSQIANILMVESPKLADAAILTGYNEDSEADILIEAVAPRIAALQDKKWAHLDPGYVTWVDVYSLINA
jgi:hypothetical protein